MKILISTRSFLVAFLLAALVIMLAFTASPMFWVLGFVGGLVICLLTQAEFLGKFEFLPHSFAGKALCIFAYMVSAGSFYSSFLKPSLAAVMSQRLANAQAVSLTLFVATILSLSFVALTRYRDMKEELA